ncbi:AtpZ/AtpI family protein [Afifella sp. IM 167]|uniref:AtpZ/AtpI family protein n=1 Tax=Afifella sp. IM 167 TaxID=2033586 RepID=UPI001CCAB0A7|nr:AtpZ/AtpI family protein [Afifella sp. IM 167]MBZ8133356.1 ATP F0F1 synthase subunit I [Afifella sp. IM 167]
MADDRSEEERKKTEGGQGPFADVDLARRMAALSRSLEEGKRGRDETARRFEGKGGSGYAAAMRLASEFVAGVLVGAALGWGLDEVAGTSPWGLIGFLLLGFAAGVLNALRAAGKIAEPDDRLAKNKDGGPSRHE